ncbi:MAG: hypothetical protein DDT26_00234 [Dehalococcoidia bacterium]|nr:hypothetical protein [Chloroflexota bacterium]
METPTQPKDSSIYTPFSVTARLANGLVASNDYTPELSSILEYFWLEQRGLLQSCPNPETAINADIPIAKHVIGRDWQWAISAPIYTYTEHTETRRRHWDADFDYPINWGKRSQKIQTDAGKFKSFRKPIFVRLTDCITWYAVGDLEATKALLSECRLIGANRNTGYGRVLQWSVKVIAEDWSLVREGQLMAPTPCAVYSDLGIDLAGSVMHWNRRAPRWDKTQADLCVMPNLVKRHV